MQTNQNSHNRKMVLLIEKNADLVARIKENSQRYFPLIVVEQAETLKTGLQKLLISAYNVICLNMSQFGSEHILDFLFTLRDAKSTRLMFYPVENINARAYLLSRGADVCLTTNYLVDQDADKELAFALCALLRRCMESHSTPGQIVHRELCIDPLRRMVTMKDCEIPLTALEFNILYLLASNPGIVFSKEHIYECIWRDYTFYGCKSVSDHIYTLRKKLGLCAKSNDYIITRINAGYKFSP